LRSSEDDEDVDAGEADREDDELDTDELADFICVTGIPDADDERLWDLGESVLACSEGWGLDKGATEG
jgi:hypothetical protein